MGLFTKKCPYCGSPLRETGYSAPYPQYRCLNCIRNNDLAKQLEDIKKSIINTQNNNQNDNR